MKCTYLNAATEIELWIKRKKLGAGSPVPSIRSLASQFKLKLSTANRACLLLISQGRIERVGYKMFVAAGPAAPAVLPIAVISAFPWFNHEVARVLGQSYFNCKQVSLDPGEPHITETALKRFDPRQVAGLIIWPLEVGPKEVERFRKLKIPIVICGCELEGFASVAFDADLVVEKAIGHLVEQGHRRIGFLWPSSRADLALPPKGHDWTMPKAFRRACHLFGLKSREIQIFEIKDHFSNSWQSQVREIRKKHPEITAYFGQDVVCQQVFAVWPAPRNVSVISYLDSPDIRRAWPELTAVAGLEHQRLASLACSEIVSQIRARSIAGASSHIRVAPRLLVQSSVQTISARSSLRSQESRAALDRDPVMTTWNKMYSLLTRKRENNWQQIDLSKYANRSLSHRNGWFGGYPLLHFPPGIRSIHGVPFRVMDESLNKSRGAIVFLSPYTRTMKGKPLTTKVRVPVNSQARAVYFLHGCGWPAPGVFATYRLHLRSGETCVVPMVAWLEGRHNSSRVNIQDWWPYGQRRNFPHAYSALVTDWANPMEYERYLYTLEWINPQGRSEVESITVEVDPAVGTVLGLLAISVLL